MNKRQGSRSNVDSSSIHITAVRVKRGRQKESREAACNSAVCTLAAFGPRTVTAPVVPESRSSPRSRLACVSVISATNSCPASSNPVRTDSGQEDLPSTRTASTLRTPQAMAGTRAASTRAGDNKLSSKRSIEKSARSVTVLNEAHLPSGERLRNRRSCSVRTNRTNGRYRSSAMPGLHQGCFRRHGQRPRHPGRTHLSNREMKTMSAS